MNILSQTLNFRTLLKNKAALIVVALFSMGLHSCKVDEGDMPEPTGDLRINIVHHVDGSDVVLDEMNYTNEADNEYMISQLQYYLSNFEFSGGTCGDHTPEASYHLMSIVDDPNLGGIYEKTTIDLTLNTGCYKNMAFHVGVDDDRRINGPYTGDLSSIWNMAWDWSGDFIYMKFAGDFTSTDETEESFVYHLAGENLYKRVNLALDSELTIEGGKSHEITIYANLNEIFKGPNTIDLNTDPSTMAPGSELADKLGDNYANMFSVSKN